MRQEVLFRNKNFLFNGDNLDILRYRIASESVDLVYLDPPFNSDKDYSIIFNEQDEEGGSEAQIKAFGDTWRWGPAARDAYRDAIENGPEKLADAMQAFHTFLGPNHMLAYLSMMAPRLVELHRVLKPTGSIFLHCDPTASHYLKLLMDAIFGPKLFRNEIAWRYSGWNKKLKRHFERRHDVILFYARSKDQKFNSYALPWDSEEQYLKVRKQKRHEDKNGNPYVMSDAGGGKRVRRYLHEAMKYGRPVDDVWNIDKLNNSSRESMHYPTQKPLALLERIIEAGSERGETILDPFCGCGTAIDAAEKLNRRWVGIDITQIAIDVVIDRLEREYGSEIHDTYTVIRDPVSVPDAMALAALKDKYEFQWWVLDRLGAARARKKKGSDKGVDGRIYFHDTKKGPAKRIIISVKGGKTGPAHVRDLLGTMETDKATIGVFVTIKKPTTDMELVAMAAGVYHSDEWGRDYDRLQIMTVEDIIAGNQVDYPTGEWHTVKGFRPRMRPEGRVIPMPEAEDASRSSKSAAAKKKRGPRSVSRRKSRRKKEK
jgi:DNA modification methylase